MGKSKVQTSVLEHEELIHLARLLGHHVGGVNFNSKLDRIADKLLAYAERVGEERIAYQPLKLVLIPCNEPGRVMFNEEV